jgi:cytochrome c-type biogenesis protein CcmI
MLILSALLLVGLSVFLILQPLVTGQEAPLHTTVDEPSEAQFKKRVSLLQLRDAEYEYAMGKLGEEDYQALRKEISAEALAAIREEEGEQRGEAADFARGSDDIEEEIAQVRVRLTGGAFCSECGYPNGPDAKFCAECGTSIQAPQPAGQG